MRAALVEEAKTVMEEQGTEVAYTFGTMIEIPRAAITAAEIAEEAEFFSFGTNDLTQTTFGISRDDAEQGFLVEYLQNRVLDANPWSGRSARGGGRDPGSRWGSAASTAAIRPVSRSATGSGSTTSRARPSGCRSRGSPRRRRCWTRRPRRAGEGRYGTKESSADSAHANAASSSAHASRSSSETVSTALCM